MPPSGTPPQTALRMSGTPEGRGGVGLSRLGGVTSPRKAVGGGDEGWAGSERPKWRHPHASHPAGCPSPFSPRPRRLRLRPDGRGAEASGRSVGTAVRDPVWPDPDSGSRLDACPGRQRRAHQPPQREADPQKRLTLGLGTKPTACSTWWCPRVRERSDTSGSRGCVRGSPQGRR